MGPYPRGAIGPDCFLAFPFNSRGDEYCHVIYLIRNVSDSIKDTLLIFQIENYSINVLFSRLPYILSSYF